MTKEHNLLPTVDRIKYLLAEDEIKKLAKITNECLKNIISNTQTSLDTAAATHMTRPQNLRQKIIRISSKRPDYGKNPKILSLKPNQIKKTT